MTNDKIKLDGLNRDSVAAFVSKDKHPVIVLLDNVRSLNNVGSFFRTCDAFNVAELVLTGITATPPHKDIQKTALGATQTVKWSYFESTLEAVLLFKEKGYLICAVEQATTTTFLQNFELTDQPIVLIFGNEVDGVAQTVIDASDVVLEVPQFGTKHSLNVSVTGGAVLWEVTKQYISKIIS